MGTMRFISGFLCRLTITTTLAALVLGTTGLIARAESRDDTTYNHSVFQIAMCEAAGGHAEVTTYMTGAGAYVVTVTCRGGLLDGMNCQNGFPGDADNCWWAWRAQPGSVDVPNIIEVVQTREEPAEPGPGDVIDAGPVEDSVVIEPVVPEPTATPMPEVTVTQDGEVDTDPIVDGEDGEVAPIEPPIVDDGAVETDVIPVDIEDIQPMETPEPFLL